MPHWRLIVSSAIGLSISAGVVLAAEEWWWLRNRAALTRDALREMALSLSTLPPNLVVSVLMTGAWVVLYSGAGALAIWHFPKSPVFLLLAFLAVDLSYYWQHRCAHRSNALWALYHAVHHGSPAYTVATAYRVSFVNQFVAPAFYLPCVLAGFDPVLVLALQVLSLHYQAWVHTEMIGPLGWIDGVFNTPANHRMHHSLARKRDGANFGAVMVLWDRLFGTYAAPEPVPAYGTAGASPPRTMGQVYLQPLQSWQSARRNLRSAPAGRGVAR